MSALLQPHAGWVGAAAAACAGPEPGAAVLLCGFHGSAEPRGWSPAVCLLPPGCERASRGCGTAAAPSSGARSTPLPLSLPFPTLLIRLALYGTRAHPIKQAHSRRWTVSAEARHDTRKTSSLTVFSIIFLFFPHRKD